MLLKNEVVELMTDTINNMNRKTAIDAGLTMEEIDHTLNEMQFELNRVNGILFDVLKEHGIIP